MAKIERTLKLLENFTYLHTYLHDLIKVYFTRLSLGRHGRQREQECLQRGKRSLIHALIVASESSSMALCKRNSGRRNDFS